MSSTVAESAASTTTGVLDLSTTTSALDLDDEEDSTNDRYTVRQSPSKRLNQDGAESIHNNSSFRPVSDASESSYGSRTYETSYVSYGSETLDRTEFLDDGEFTDIDNLSLESQPMMMDRFVDSTCSCLDYPAMVYQKMCLGSETSLLKQSQGRTRPIYQNTATPTNVGIAAAKRRTLRIDSKANANKEDTKDFESTIGDEKKNEMKIMKIQPEEDLEIEGSENKRNSSRQDDSGSDNSSRIHSIPMNESRSDIETKKTSGESHSISHASTKSMLERAIQTVAKEDEERDTNANRSKTFEEEDVKIDPPSDTEIDNTRGGEPADSSPSSSDDRPSEGVPLRDEKSMEVAADPSGRGQRSPSPASIEQMNSQRSPSPPLLKQTTSHRSPSPPPSPPSIRQTRSKEASRRSNRALRTQDKEIVDQDEIIDVISIDDQDSWTPGSNAKPGENDHQENQNSSRSNDRSISSTIPLKGSKSHDRQHDRPLTDDASTVDNLWSEEEAKLNKKAPLNKARPPVSKDLVAAQSAEDLWNEERMKLQTISDVVFDDPEARKAFLMNRQERLRDAALRRHKIEMALRASGREDSTSSNAPNLNESRSTSRGRHPPPSPEILSVIGQSRSQSRERSMRELSVIGQNRSQSRERNLRNLSLIAQSRSQSRERTVMTIPLQQGNGDPPPNVNPLPSRSKDLVVRRSIEEGQRIRSSKRDTPRYTTTSRYGPDTRRPAREPSSRSSRSPYDQRLNQRHQQQPAEIDHLIEALARQRAKTRDPVGRKHVDGPVINYLLNDERDDQESLPPIQPIEHMPVPVEKKWAGYDSAITATKELRKLEKKIEKQLRRKEMLEAQTDQSKEIRRMEKKLSKKLRSIIKSDGANAQKMSSSDIRKLEKQLAQTLSFENENRSSKLKRIKSKGMSPIRGPSSHSRHNDVLNLSGYAPTPTKEVRPESSGSRLENAKSLRSRYVRRGIGRRSYTRIPDTEAF